MLSAIALCVLRKIFVHIAWRATGGGVNDAIANVRLGGVEATKIHPRVRWIRTVTNQNACIAIARAEYFVVCPNRRLGQDTITDYTEAQQP